MRIGTPRVARPSAATLRSWAAASSGGLLLYASFPPIGWWFLAPLGPALLILAVRGRRARSAFAAGGIFGIAFLAPLIVWLANLGLVPWLTLTAIQALVFALAAMPLPRLVALPGWPLYTAAWWVALEAVRGRTPLGGFPGDGWPSGRRTLPMPAGPLSAAAQPSPSPLHSSDRCCCTA